MNFKIKKSFYKYIFIFIFFIYLLVYPSFVLAISRRVYLEDFVMQNYHESSGGFYEYRGNSSTSVDTSILATKCSLSILSRLDILKSKILDDSSKSVRTKNYLKDELAPSITENNTIKISYILEGLKLLDAISDIDMSIKNDIYTYLSKLKRTYDGLVGYTLTPNENQSATVVGTYFAIKIYYYLGDLNIIDKTGIINYVKSCLKDAKIGKGFQSNTTSGIISLENTFAAISILKILDSVTELSTNEKDQIINYLDSFYNNNSDDKINYGGYSFYIEDEIKLSTFLATYYATITRYNLYSSYIPSDITIKWILDHQNPDDGGFMDNILPGLEQHSSTVISYYAVEILYLKDSELKFLDQSVWSIDINWWLIFGILILTVGILIAIIIKYKRRTRI